LVDFLLLFHSSFPYTIISHPQVPPCCFFFRVSVSSPLSFFSASLIKNPMLILPPTTDWSHFHSSQPLFFRGGVMFFQACFPFAPVFFFNRGRPWILSPCSEILSTVFPGNCFGQPIPHFPTHAVGAPVVNSPLLTWPLFFQPPPPHARLPVPPRPHPPHTTCLLLKRSQLTAHRCLAISFCPTRTVRTSLPRFGSNVVT